MKVSKIIACLMLFLFAVSFLGCEKDYSPTDIKSWVEDPSNGLIKVKKAGDLVLRAQHKPLQYIVGKELRNNEVDAELYQERLQKLEGLQYYDIQIGTLGHAKRNITNYQITNEEEYNERINYLSYRMKNDLKLVEGGDTLTCKLFHFERSMDMQPYRTFLIAFEQKEDTKQLDKTLIFESDELSLNPIKFKFQQQSLERIPSIKL